MTPTLAAALDRLSADRELAERSAGETGYPAPLVADHLARLFGGLARAVREVPSGPVVPRGPLVVWAAGTIPGTALPAAVAGLAVGIEVVLKVASGETATARALEQAVPGIRAVSFPHTDREQVRSLLHGAGALIAFGGEAALAALREVSPPGLPRLEFGPRTSIAVLGEPALGPDRLGPSAASLARDTAEFDQQGCYSPQGAFVEDPDGSRTEALADALAGELDRLAVTLPRRTLSPPESAAIHRFRASWEVRAGRGRASLRASPAGTGWTVIVSPEPALEPGPLNRTLVLHPVPDLSRVIPLVAARRGFVSTAAVAGVDEEHTARWRKAGVRRVCSLGQAQRPDVDLRHEGIDLVSWLRGPTAPGEEAGREE